MLHVHLRVLDFGLDPRRSPAPAENLVHMDHLVLGPFLLDKASQPALRDDVGWRSEYQLD